MRKLTAFMLASSLALGASMANAAETTATPTTPAAPVATKADGGAPMLCIIRWASKARATAVCLKV